MLKKLQILINLGMTRPQAEKALTGGVYFQDMGGTSIESYWQDSGSFDIRDEFYLVSNAHLALAYITRNINAENWLLKFQVAFLYHVKLNAQSIKSIEVLTSNKCYADAFAVCRALHSRVNFLLLCGFSPELYNHWLKNPKDDRYLDGRVRRELASHGVLTMEHVYELSSEIIHGQFLGHANIGYFEKGLFPEIPVIRNQIYVIAKFLLAASSYALIQATLIGSTKDTKLEDIKEMDQLHNLLFKSILDPSRLDHLWAIIAEERHWVKTGKEKYKVGEAFNFNHYKDQLLKFHRLEKQKKQLSKKYQIKEKHS